VASTGSAEASVVAPVVPERGASARRSVVDDADWPHTKRLQPWLVVVLLATVFLVPIDSIKLPISLPVDARPDRIVLLACIGLSLVVLAVRPRGAQRVGHRYGLIDVTIFLFIAVAVMSVALNLDTLQALDQVAPTIKRFAVIFAYLGFFLIVVNSVRASELDAYIRLVIVLATIAAAGTALQYATGFNVFFWFFEKVLPPGTSFTGSSSLRTNNGRPDITGPTRHGLAVCTMVAMFIPFALTRAIDAVARRDRLLYSAAAVIMVVGCVCTLRRTGIILPFVAVSAVIVFGGRRMIPVAVVTAVLIALAPVVVPGTVSQLRYQFSSQNTANQQSSAGRRSDYGAIVPDLEANTLLGRGYATYDASRYRYLDNQYLGTMIGIGAIGTGIYVLMMATAGGFALRIGRRLRGSPGSIGLAAAGAILAFAVANALFDTLAFPQAPYAFFLVLAFVAILRRRPDVRSAESRTARAIAASNAPPPGPVPPATVLSR
jgi:hypothetical protein